MKAYGKCMFPIIDDNNIILAKVVKKNEEIRIGDIIICNIDDEIGCRSGLGCHRVINIIKNKEEYVYVTKGDNRVYEDKPISFDEIIGKSIINLTTKQKLNN